VLASFQYTGTGRRVAFNRGGTALSPVVHSSVFDNPIADWDQSGGPDPEAYFGLNHFGQTRALAYWRKVGTEDIVLAAHRYAHDAAGRRTAIWTQHIEVAPPTGPPVGTNERSQHFAYDMLGRLVEADMGKLTGPLDGTLVTTKDIETSDLMPLARRVDWALDARDTWTLRSEILDENEDGDGGDTSEDESASFKSHFVGDRNELLDYADPATHAGPTPAPEDRFHNDDSGNLILDDDRFYEYDAWGRLVKVSERGTLALDIPLENEEPELEGTPGRWLVHYTYDALGRLIRKQTPVRDGTTLEQLALRTERYYYDGARRIQEVATEPIIDIDPEPQGPGGPSGGLTLAEEMELLEGESEANIFVDREYVYVPSGASGYVDEFICQIDRYQDLWYILQDVNYNVIALTDSGGEVVRQHTFDPYGEILTAEDFDTHPGIKIGHQGLFFDRLEPSAPAGGLISMSAAVQLQPGVFGLYQARNRVLLPRYGRWAQKDPNASGMLHASLWHDGEAPMPELTAGRLADALETDQVCLHSFETRHSTLRMQAD
jgi:YD repeat-containing protein